VTADRTLKDDFDGKLVDVQAQLVGRDSTSPDSRLEMQANGVLFSAILPREIPQSVSERWKDGSLVRVTGICSTEVNTFSIGIGDGIVRPESVKILLRDGDDIVVLRAASWWTPQHTWESFGAIVFVVGICLAWIGILRHLVKNRTNELRISQERLRHLSEHDALTDLPNRIFLHDRLSTALQRVRRFNGHLGLLMADLDGFKEINDTMGHKAGDTVLREVAGRLSGSVRCTDTVARIGGDEFVILITDLDHAEMAELVAANLVAVLAEPLLIDGKLVRVTASIGIVTFPDDGVSEETLMQLADEAMYRAKQRGKNRIEAYNQRESFRLDPLTAFKGSPLHH
jgi:diguanylate cyclase (GGDEF)-like protein